jgi:CRISPR-associated protein Cas2
MALNQIRSWLIAYDIANPRRLRRVHRALRECAVPVQYSVFAARCSAAKLGSIRMSVAGLIAKREDDVRFYPVPEPASIFVHGRKALPEGLQLLDASASVDLAARQGHGAFSDDLARHSGGWNMFRRADPKSYAGRSR